MKNNTVADLKEDLLDYTKDWAKRTEKILGTRMAKSLVRVSDPSRRNFNISSSSTTEGIKIEIRFRTSLRFTDGGFGRGYSKGRKISGKSGKGRKQKQFLNKVIRRRIYQLSDAVEGKTIETILKNTDIE